MKQRVPPLDERLRDLYPDLDFARAWAKWCAEESVDAKHPGLRRRLWRKVEKRADGHWVWTGASSNHVPHTQTSNGVWMSGRRAAYMLVYGPVDPRFGIDAACGEYLCIRPDHLRAATVSAITERRGTRNRGDRNGMRRFPDRRARGDRHGRCKLTDAQVLDARDRYCRLGKSSLEIATDLGISHGGAVDMLSGRKWQHLNTADYIQRYKAAAIAAHRQSSRSNARAAGILSVEVARQIRQRHSAGAATIADLAREFGVVDGTIRKVLRGERWSDAATPFIAKALEMAQPTIDAALEQARQGETPEFVNVAEGGSARVEMALSRWYGAGFPRCTLSEKQAADMMATRVPWDDLRSDSVRAPWPCFLIDVPGGLLGESITHLLVRIEDGDDRMPAVVSAFYASADRVVGEFGSGRGFAGLGEYTDPRDVMAASLVVECCHAFTQSRRVIAGETSAGAKVFAPPPIRRDASGNPECAVFKVTRSVTVDSRTVVREYVGGARRDPPFVRTMVRTHDATFWTGKGRTETIKKPRRGHWRGPTDAPIALRSHRLADARAQGAE